MRDENLQLSLVARGLGVALVTKRSVRRHPRAGRLRVMKLTAQALKLDIMVVRGAYVGRLDPAIDMIQERLGAALTRRVRSRHKPSPKLTMAPRDRVARV